MTIAGPLGYRERFPVTSLPLMSPSAPRVPRASATVPTEAADGSPVAAPVAGSYEAALAELERLVGDLEGGKLELEASLAAYQRGSALLRYCQGQLAQAEQQVRVLEGEDLVPMQDDQDERS